jgi:riboflavin kinase, archaea type
MPTLRGRVVSGLGDFSYWMARLADHYTRKTGLVLFPGTLNLELDSPYRIPPEVIRPDKEESR